MIQRQIRHDPGTFPVCATCNHEPRHIQAQGSLSTERRDVLPPGGLRHRLECHCDARMAWCDSLAQAETHWRRHFSAPFSPIPRSARPLLRLHKEA